MCVPPPFRKSPRRTGSGRHFRRPRQAERLASAVCRLPARGLASAQLVTVLGGPRPSDRRAPQLQNGKKRPLENGLKPPSFRANGNGPREVVVRTPHNETERFPGGGLRAPLDTKRKRMASGRWSRWRLCYFLVPLCGVLWCGVVCSVVRWEYVVVGGPRDTDWQVHNFWVRSEAIGPQTGQGNLWLCSETPDPMV